MQNPLKIVFMGTPDFAVPSLQILVENNYNIVAVITAPDKPAGRGKQINESAIKQFAIQHHLNVLQPTNLKDSAFIKTLQNLQADLFIVVAFRMLPEIVWKMPKLGTFNLHASLLPKYRGAAPINWAVINGEKETGATTFFLQHEIDTGNIILQEKIAITDEDNAGTVHDKLMLLGADLVLKTVQAIEQNNYTLQQQDWNENLPHAPKIFKEDGNINWQDTATNIHNKIRGLSPYPTAYTTLLSKNLKIYKTRITKDTNIEQHYIANNIYSDGSLFLAFKTADDFILVQELQLEGKKRMLVQDFLRGFKF
ncbi:MAG: methionyl-tRNA formyltransferase [Chitinophagales bacterium]|nr:methionyl-tRNA formyltransferase [Chitinophagales bacterium]